MDNKDTIGEFLELEPLKKDITKAKEIVSDSKLDNDFEYARGNLYQVIENGSNALTELLEVAQQSQHPRAFEVVGQLIGKLTDTNKELLNLHKTKKDLRLKMK